MNMIERVARAIYQCDGAIYGTDDRMFEPYPFDELDEIQVAGFMDRARAAIKEMREPTARMLIDAGTISGWDAQAQAGADECHIAWWSDMIDAALQEEG